MTSRTGSARRILGDFEKVKIWELDTERGGWLSLARWDLCGRCYTCWVGADEKARIERLCLSPCVEEPLNSKLIKKFVPELRSRQVFFEFRDPMFCLYGHSMYVSHIVISWLWYKVSRTLLSILVVFNKVVVWMVSTRPPTSKSSRPFNNPLVTVPKAPITIGIIVTFMFHSFFNSLARSRYLSLFSYSFSFILWSAGTAKSTILQIFFFFFFVDYYRVWSSGRD